MAWFLAGLALMLPALLSCGGGRKAVTLSVETTPPGARVTMDGRFFGLTPIHLKPVDAGVHRLEITAPSFFAHGADLDIKGDTRYAAVLLPTVGRLRLTIWPPPVRLFIDGDPVEMAESHELTSGVHELAVDGGWMGFHRKTVRIQADRETAVRWDLVRPKTSGEIRLETEPAGAAVIFDGLPWGKTPLTLPPLEARRPFGLVLRGEQGEEVQTTVQVSPRERKVMKVNLVGARLSVLHVMGVPKQALLQITGPLPGIQTRIHPLPESGLLSLPKGRYRVQTSPAGFYPMSGIGASGSNAPPLVFRPVRRLRLKDEGFLPAGPEPPIHLVSLSWGQGRLWALDGTEVKVHDGRQWNIHDGREGSRDLVSFGSRVLSSAELPVSGQGWAMGERELFAVSSNGWSVLRWDMPDITGGVLDVWKVTWPKGSTPEFSQGAVTPGAYVAVASASRGGLWLETGATARSNVPKFRRWDGVLYPAGVATDGRLFFLSDRETGRITVLEEDGTVIDRWQTARKELGLLAWGQGNLYSLVGKNQVCRFKIEEIP